VVTLTTQLYIQPSGQETTQDDLQWKMHKFLLVTSIQKTLISAKVFW